MDQSKKPEYQRKLLELVPADGGAIGNSSLRQELRTAFPDDEITNDDYWLIRSSLIEDGLVQPGRGKGGSVRKVVHEPVQVPQAEAGAAAEGVAAIRAEADLYEPFHNAIRTGYAPANSIRNFISEVTARQGRRATGGKWTRPDLTLLAVRMYTFTPGKRLEVITFEVKESLDVAVEGVFESLAHSVFAHRSYLAVHIPGYQDLEGVAEDRIIQECERFGVGYIVFDDPSNYDTYEIVVSARLKDPDPAEVDNFIRQQIGLQNQEQIRDWIR